MTEINTKTLTEEQRERLEAHNHNKEQMGFLSDIASKIKGLSTLLEAQSKNKDIQGLEALLGDIKQSMEGLVSKEPPEALDFAKPVVKAVAGLEKSFKKAIEGIELNPEFKVSPTPVDVKIPKPDFKGIEKILKTEMPKAFKKAISQIPETTFPAIPDRWDEVIELLGEIDTATRMKPLQGSIKVTNPDGTDIGGGGLTDTELRATAVPVSGTVNLGATDNAVLDAIKDVLDIINAKDVASGTDFDHIDGQQTSATVDTYVYKTGGSGGTTVQTVVVTYTNSAKTDVDTVAYS